MATYGNTLTENLKGAFKKSLEVGDYKLDEDQMKVVSRLADDLADGITKFIQDQTFRVTEMKAICEMEKIGTAGTYNADVLPQVKVIPGQVVETKVQTQVASGIGVMTSGGGGSTISPGSGKGDGKGKTRTEGKLKGSNSGVRIPKVNFSKTGGQGGVMTSKGYAYIGNNPVGSSSPKNTKVKLTKVVNK